MMKDFSKHLEERAVWGVAIHPTAMAACSLALQVVMIDARLRSLRGRVCFGSCCDNGSRVHDDDERMCLA